MCTYATVNTTLQGSAKGPDSKWFHVTDGTVYFDHPVHAMAEHTLNIDFSAPSRGPGGRADGSLGPRARDRHRSGSGLGAGGAQGLSGAWAADPEL